MGSPATTASHATNPLTGPGTYFYDGNGNPTTFGGTALTWDVENRMTAHGTALEAAYRGDGLRAWKEAATRTYFLYDGINVVCELDAVGDLLAASTFGAAGLLSRGDVQYQFDPLGDAVHLLDTTGDVLANRLFDAWGNELTSGDFAPRGYRANYGYYTDEETGLIALAYRYYGPGVGRFLSRDPIGYAGGVALYGYVSANVLLSIDRTGMASMVVVNKRGFVYDHVYLRVDCGNGETSFGFWPAGSCPLLSAGKIESPDPHSDGEVSRKLRSARFDKALCQCIAASQMSTPYFAWPILPLYVCSSWARQMWGCAEMAVPDDIYATLM